MWNVGMLLQELIHLFDVPAAFDAQIDASGQGGEDPRIRTPESTLVLGLLRDDAAVGFRRHDSFKLAWEVVREMLLAATTLSRHVNGLWSRSWDICSHGEW